MGRNIELIRYKRFGDELLLLELVNATSAPMAGGASEVGSSSTSYKTIGETLQEINGPTRDLYEELSAYLLALGDDIQQKTLKYYIAYKRLKNFACVEVFPSKRCVRVFVKVNPDSIELRTGFTRDVRKIGHFGTGDLEITLASRDDLETAKPLLQKSYEQS